jgi:hypothetical protein
MHESKQGNFDKKKGLFECQLQAKKTFTLPALPTSSINTVWTFGKMVQKSNGINLMQDVRFLRKLSILEPMLYPQCIC